MPQIMLVCACAHDTVFEIPSNWIYHTPMLACVRHLDSFGLPLTNLDLHVQIPELGAWNPPVADQSAWGSVAHQ